MLPVNREPKGGKAMMNRKIGRREFIAGAAFLGAGALLPVGSGRARRGHQLGRGRGFVRVVGDRFFLGGRPFYFAGTNNYYMHYKSHRMIDDVLHDAAAMGLSLLRCWGFIDGQPADGFVLQPEPYTYPEEGYERIDYTVWRARRYGLKLVIALTNNWPDFGGMEQYVRWFGGSSHDEFYTNPEIRIAYKAYVEHFLRRRNRYTGVRYMDDPTIMAWELANEPRCQSDVSGLTLRKWVDEMSTFIKRLDRHHLVAVGDEGFYRQTGRTDWTRNGSQGVDWESLLELPNVDYATFHLYPDHWGKDLDWCSDWIRDHIRDARGRKPVVLEEFGYRDKATRDEVYRTWTQIVYEEAGSGDQFWLLTGIQDDGTLYPDYDGFRVVYPSSTAAVLSEHARAMRARGRLP